jgi:hypothetical protein
MRIAMALHEPGLSMSPSTSFPGTGVTSAKPMPSRSIFQFHDAFLTQAELFLDTEEIG